MNNRIPGLVEGVICVLAMVLAAGWLYAGAWQRGAVPMDLSPALGMAPWQEAQPLGEAQALESVALAQTTRYYPWYAWLNRGGSLLWNNSEGLGEPFFAAWRTRALSPFSLPLYFMELHAALVFSAMLKVLAAGVCAYYAARRFALPAATALLAGVTYAFSAVFVVHSPEPFSDVLPWLPLLLVTVERLVLGQWRAWPLGALTGALMLLGGDPLASAVLLGAVAVYAGLRAWQDLRAPSAARTVLGVLAGALLAAGLAGVQLAPYNEFTEQADLLPLPFTPLGVGDLFRLAHPGLGAAHGGAALAALLHIGLVPLLLLPLWMAVREFAQPTQRGRVEIAAVIAAVLSLVPVLGGGWMQALAAADGPGPEHFLLLNAWAFAFLAAAAAQEWVELTFDETRIALARLMKWLPAVWGAVLALAVAGAVRNGGWLALVFVLVVAAAIFAMLAITLFRPNARLLSYGLALVSAVSLQVCLAPHRPLTEAAAAFPETTVVKSLQKIGGRIGGSPRLQAWPLAVNGVQQVYPTSGILLNRLREFLARVQDDPLLMRRTGAQGLLLTTEDIRGPYAGVRPVLNIKEVFASGAILFRDTAAQARARLIYAGRRTEKYAPEMVASEAPPVLEGSTLPEKDDGPVAKVAITEETPSRVVFKVEKTRPAVLVLADAWYPGWRATVNGGPAPVVRVDGLFRGVELGEGEHEVVLEYVPGALNWGLGISGVSLLVLLAGLWRFLRSGE